MKKSVDAILADHEKCVKEVFAVKDGSLSVKGATVQSGEQMKLFPYDSRLMSNEEVVKLLLERVIGEDVNRGGLADTPSRVAKAWAFWASGYKVNPADVLKVFEDGAENYDDSIGVFKIPFYSHCEHHLAPIFGEASVAYVPNPDRPRIVGLSKLSRIVDVFARRLQVQERMTTDIADALAEHLEPLGVAVFIKARHLCMESRGICQQGHYTITQRFRGCFAEDGASWRSEFLANCR